MSQLFLALIVHPYLTLYKELNRKLSQIIPLKQLQLQFQAK